MTKRLHQLNYLYTNKMIELIKLFMLSVNHVRFSFQSDTSILKRTCYNFNLYSCNFAKIEMSYEEKEHRKLIAKLHFPWKKENRRAIECIVVYSKLFPLTILGSIIPHSPGEICCARCHRLRLSHSPLSGRKRKWKFILLFRDI